MLYFLKKKTNCGEKSIQKKKENGAKGVKIILNLQELGANFSYIPAAEVMEV